MDYMEVLVNPCHSHTTGILQRGAKDHAPERKESFHAKIKFSAFGSFV